MALTNIIQQYINSGVGGGGWVEIRKNPEIFGRPPSFSGKFSLTPLQQGVNFRRPPLSQTAVYFLVDPTCAYKSLTCVRNSLR